MQAAPQVGDVVIDRIHRRVDAPDQPIPVQDRQHVVAILAQVLGYVDLDAEKEIEHQVCAISITDQVIERR